MSNLEANLVRDSFVAGEDLTGAQYLAVKLNSTGKVVKAGAGEQAIGVLQNNPGNGQTASVAVWGRTKMVAGGVIAPGANVTPDANGKAVTAVAANVKTDDAGAAADDVLGGFVLGVAIVDANTAANDVFSVLITKAGLV